MNEWWMNEWMFNNTPAQNNKLAIVAHIVAAAGFISRNRCGPLSYVQ